jgi:hypothetical protein
MINKEDKKRLFLNLRRGIKGAINPASIVRSQMARIDVMIDYGTIVAKTTKQRIEEHLIVRNPKVYRAAGLTPFGDSDPRRRLHLEIQTSDNASDPMDHHPLQLRS